MSDVSRSRVVGSEALQALLTLIKNCDDGVIHAEYFPVIIDKDDWENNMQTITITDLAMTNEKVMILVVDKAIEPKVNAYGVGILSYTGNKVTFVHTSSSNPDTSFEAIVKVFRRIEDLGNYAYIPEIDCATATVVPDYIMHHTNITYLNLPAATAIGDKSFKNCSYLYEAQMPLVVSIGKEAFAYCSNLKTINCPNLETIDEYGFYGIGEVPEVSIPSCTLIGKAAFASSLIYTVNAPEVVEIKENAFYRAFNLQTASFPKCTTVRAGAFTNANNILELNLPLCTTLENSAIASCMRLRTVTLPVLTTLDANFIECNSIESLTLNACTKISNFGYMSALTSFTGNSVTRVEEGSFINMSSLESLELPACTYFAGVSSCNKLKSVRLPALQQLSAKAFSNCDKLTRVYLLNSTMVSIVDTTESYTYDGTTQTFTLKPFLNTPITVEDDDGVKQGKIVVPDSLVSTYKAATGWSDFADQIIGVTECNALDSAS